ncbi:hypothetical protein [Streptomyces sp. NPDC051677]|uniref:hypothetical protein n=1 Tax=Streptomyces sp. NPDC051677 TaxID=3365669 RepID=UPI0037D45015
MKHRHNCAVCDRPLKSGRYRACVRGCGAVYCRAPHRPPCGDVHGGQCSRLQLPESEPLQAAAERLLTALTAGSDPVTTAGSSTAGSDPVTTAGSSTAGSDPVTTAGSSTAGSDPVTTAGSSTAETPKE